MITRSLFIGAALISAAELSHAATRVKLVLKQGDVVAGSTATDFSGVYTARDGWPGFQITLADGRRAIHAYTGIQFISDQLPPNTLTGGEGSIGVGNGGKFIYSPSFNGGDSVVTQDGRLMVANDPIPGTSEFSTFHSRPMMLPSGEAIWIGGFTATSGGSTAGRVIFRCPDTTNPATITNGLRSGNVLPGGLTITSTGLGFTYDFSDDGLNHIQRIIVSGGGPTNEIVYFNGNKIARVGEAAFGTELWSSFNVVATNNLVDSLFSGNTNGPTTADEVLVFNGNEVLREGQVVDGVTLGSLVDWAALDGIGRFGVIWDSSRTETLFIGRTTNFGGARAVLSVGDQLDIDGDNIADYTLTDFNPSTTIERSGELTNHPLVYFNVDITPIGGGATLVAVLGVRTAPCAGDVDYNGRIDLLDLARLLASFGFQSGATSLDGDSDGDGDVDLTDLSAQLANFGDDCL